MINEQFYIRLIRNVLGTTLRGNFKALEGFMRYIFYRKSPITSHDYTLLQQLILECGLPIDKFTLDSLLARKPIVVQFNDRTRFVVTDLEDFYHASLCYEEKTLKFILNHLSNGGVFVDVGANIGGYTVRAAKVARVYAFEPDPRNFKLLELNVKINKIESNVKAFQKAVGGYLGKAKLTLSNFHGRHSLLHTHVKSQQQKYSIIDVDMVTLDYILAAEEYIDIIKIDVEGAEPLVLKGASNILKKTNIVIIEATYSPSFYRCLSFLTKYSFKPLKIGNNVAFIRM